MRAAVVSEFGSPAHVDERPIPQPGAGQVLVRLETCGLCHTDIHAMHGDWPVKPNLPLVPGHEGVGIIEQIGDGVTGRTVGQRVAMPWLGHACGECRYCVSGRENLCEQQYNNGYAVDGGFSEYMLADARFATPVPDGVSALDAAPLTCAGVTTYAAIKNARVTPGETVAIFGVGGLGHLAVQYARLVGAKVIAVDVTTEKLDLATELGADHVVNARDTDPVQAIRDLGGADVVVVLAVAPAVFHQAFSSLNRGGRLVLVSLPAGGELTVPVFDTVLKGISIIGSIVGTRQDLAEVFALHAAGRTRVVTETRELQSVNSSVDEVLAGTVPARLVFQYHTADVVPVREPATAGR
ncbi:Alcohol dehydrogenase [Microbacterium sp. Bi98]|uniref:zinc-dependent alcohol dehydrogenase n=1 Tax=unclassified Microbacterium TaxID=2609290 RepID=UPI0006F7F9DC|nr:MULTISPECIES: zinc-dependent alcohol dehydrogenase [unclassified Microbacterium]KRD54705.1 alcohol dehydrogenase [Microbacterium sp. Root280D1]CAH0210908.1 Alcohol dehydrogenase [Microbacterium sp. Bi98]